jgi:hypothetical protein
MVWVYIWPNVSYFIFNRIPKKRFTTCPYIAMDRLKGNEITRDMIDLWISAEIPDPNEDPLGYVLVA